MNPALVNAYALMLPRLQAEEALLERMVIASGTNSLKKDADSRFVKQLNRTARISSGRRVRTLDDLRGMGIQVVDERRKGVSADG